MSVIESPAAPPDPQAAKPISMASTHTAPTRRIPDLFIFELLGMFSLFFDYHLLAVELWLEYHM